VEGYVRREIRHVGHPFDGVHLFWRLPVLDAEALVKVVAYGHLILFGDAEHGADDPHGKVGAEVADEIEAAGAGQGIQGVGTVLTHPLLEDQDPA
jgi:hypothetical protein